MLRFDLFNLKTNSIWSNFSSKNWVNRLGFVRVDFVRLGFVQFVGFIQLGVTQLGVKRFAAMAFAMGLFSQNLLASNVVSLSGQVIKRNQKIFLREDKTNKNWLLHFSNDDSKNSEIIDSLESEDFISALGANRNNKEFEIKNIEYIGFRSLLGTWSNMDTMIDFQNFTTSVVMSSDFGKNSCQIYTSQVFYYIITPSTTSDNQIFFSNNEQVISGTLSRFEDSLILEIFDQETGSLQKRLLLNKINSR